MLERKLGTLLMEKDPQTGLTRFVPRGQTGDWSWILAAQLEDWAVKNPDRAIAWLAGQIAAGAFKSKVLGATIRVPREMISESVFALLPIVPEAAGRMLAVLPKNQRLDPLGSIHLAQMKESEHDAWAAMVRANLSPEDQLKAITYPTANWSDGDGAPMSLPETSAYLSRIAATPEEIAACVLSVVEDEHSGRSRLGDLQSPLADDIATLRVWTANQAPALVDSATAIGLGAVGRHEEIFPEAAKLALRFHETSGKDELLIPLLESSGASENKALARTLAAGLSDAKKRETYQRNFK
jgi:hypothetical protein